MRQGVRLLFVTFVLIATRSTGESPLLFRKRVSEVRLTVVATDRDGRPVPALSPQDIVVLEDGRSIPNFDLRPAGELPLRVGIVLDLSDSTQKSWTAVRAALIQPLRQIMRPGDESLILSFSTKIVAQTVVTAPSQLEDALAQPHSTGGLTALYDTVYQVADDPIFQNDGEPTRSALILFSDGEDDLSLHGLSDAIARAELDGDGCACDSGSPYRLCLRPL